MKLRDKISKIFSSRAFYITFSLLASFTIWLYVASVENPDVSIGIGGIKIETKNSDYLTDRGLVVTSVTPGTMSLRVLGKRNVISTLSSSNIVVTVDLSNIMRAGSYTLLYTVSYPVNIASNSVSITARSNDYVTVNVDNLVKKDVTVKGTYDGGVEKGYRAEPIEIKPETVTISGPEDTVANISYAWVSVRRNNISKTVDEDLPFILMDENGKEVPPDSIVMSQSTVRVKIPVVKVKDVPLTVNLTPGAGATEKNAVCTIIPSTISLSGDASTLDGLNQIVLGTIDLSSFINTKTQTFTIAIPNNTTNLTGTTEASVTVSVNGLDTKQFDVTNIQAGTGSAGIKYAVVTQNLNVTLRGTGDSLDNVKPENIRVVADLSGLGSTTGTFTVPAKVYVDGDTANLGAVGNYTVTVQAARG